MHGSEYVQLVEDARVLRPNPRIALVHLLWIAIVTILGTTLSASPQLGLWLVGQILFAIAMVQWFVILHECGHGTFFGIRRADNLLGHVASFFAVIPFHAWRTVHRMHHRWTGWLDLDPTGEAVVPRPVGISERIILNTCWRLWLPLFAFSYRINNYWNISRLRRRLRRRSARIVAVNVTILAGAYAIAIAIIGVRPFASTFGVAVLLSLVILEPILLSQHTHVPWRLSNGARVRPIEYREQDVFTRSLAVPSWIARFVLFNFNAHELHHLVPAVPGYRLNELALESPKGIPWLVWLRRAKALPAHVLIFSDSRTTGLDI